MKRLLALLFAIPLIIAANPHAGASTGMVLTHDYFNNGPNPTSPTYCYHEDSVHNRAWEGTLGAGESFEVDLQFCDPTMDGVGPGGAGIMYQATFWDGHQSLSLKVINPDGSTKLAHIVGPGWLWGCELSYLQDNDVIRTTMQSGTYRVILTNTGTKAISSAHPIDEGIDVQMSNRVFQDAYCPAEDRNEGPVI